MNINIVGAGLAGCEAAWQLSKRGVQVNLFEMKPKKFSPAHKNKNFAELVCSNSLKANRIESAAGLLKEEMRKLDSLIVKCADETRVPAGGALAVDRNKFSGLVTSKIKNNKLINIIEKEVEKIDPNEITIIATGPLTSDALSKEISKFCGDFLSFYDAAAPIVTVESINMEYAFEKARYDKGEASDYINCPLNKEEYDVFYKELINAEKAKLHNFDKKVYEGCMPIEIMASRGENTIRFGPMKPVGLRDPRTERRPWAVLQLRKENIEATLYNLVGFQTNLKFSEQERVFKLIPALSNAEFVRYGVMHRNTFINSPRILNQDMSLKSNNKIFFAGQITGVEGYMESTSSGLVAGINAYLRFNKKNTIIFPKETMIGALMNHTNNLTSKDYQPMGANFGIIPSLSEKIKDKKERYKLLSQRSLNIKLNNIE